MLKTVTFNISIFTLIKFKICRTMWEKLSKVGQKQDTLENLLKSRTSGRYVHDSIDQFFVKMQEDLSINHLTSTRCKIKTVKFCSFHRHKLLNANFFCKPQNTVMLLINSLISGREMFKTISTFQLDLFYNEIFFNG